MAKTLQLNFGTAGGKKMMLTVDEPREDLNSARSRAQRCRKSLMQESSKLKAIPLDAAISARIVERQLQN